MADATPGRVALAPPPQPPYRPQAAMVSRKGKRSIVVDGEEFLWRYWNGGAHVIDLQGTLNIKCTKRLVWVRGPRFRSVKGCGGLHRCFRCPDFFWIVSNPKQVGELIRWALKRGRDPEEVDVDDARRELGHR